MLLSNSCFQLKFQPFFLVTCLRSAFVKRLTSVSKLSPETVFCIEFVNLSITKSRCIFFSFFTCQKYDFFFYQWAKAATDTRQTHLIFIFLFPKSYPKVTLWKRESLLQKEIINKQKQAASTAACLLYVLKFSSSQELPEGNSVETESTWRFVQRKLSMTYKPNKPYLIRQ